MLIPRYMIAGQVDQDALASDVSQANKFVRSGLPINPTAAALTSGRVYAVCIGRMLASYKVTSITFNVATAGAGAQTTAKGFWGVVSGEDFNPAAPPTILTIFESQTITDSLTTVGTKNCFFSSSYRPAPSVANTNVFLWVGVCIGMATTQPSVYPLCGGIVGVGYNATSALTAGSQMALTRHPSLVLQGPDIYAQIAFA